MKAIITILWSILFLLRLVKSEQDIDEILRQVANERYFFDKEKNISVEYLDETKRRKIQDALQEKLDGFAKVKYSFPEEPKELKKGAGFSEELKYLELQYNYLWQIEDYDDANKLLDKFFNKMFANNFKFLSLRDKPEDKQRFLNLLTLYAKHFFYGMMSHKRPKIFGEKSTHLEAYLMFQLAADNGSGEAYFYLALMQSYGLDNFKDKKINFKAIKGARIDVKDYLNQRKDILANSYLYSASMSGSENAMIAMGNRYTHGIGVKKDCIASIAYKKDPAYRLATKSLIKPELNRNYHLAKDIFNMNINQSSSSNLRKRNEDKIRMAEEKALKGSQKALRQLGSIYFFGLYGQKVDYEKAFENFNLAMVKNDLNSQHMVGTMYYYGLGVQTSYKMAFEVFEKCANHKFASCYNSLGLMYQRGDWVKKDILKAYSLFKNGSELGNSYAQFNQGALLIVENGYSFEEEGDNERKPKFGRHALIEQHIKKALNLFSLSAHQHHLPSLYMLALVHVEGHEHYSSCSLSSSLMSQVLARKNSQFYSKQVDKFFDGKILQPMMVFMEAAFLGRNDGIINAMALSDKYGAKILGKWRTIEEVIEGEKELAGFTAPEDLENSDVRKVLRLFDLDTENGIEYLKDQVVGDINRLLEGAEPVYKNMTSKASYTIATNIMMHGTKYDLNMAYVRLGDYYYYGKHPDGVNFKKAYGLYKTATWYNNSVDFQAQGYLSLGYMYQFGKGCDRDLSRAREAYGQARKLGGKFSYVSYFSSVLLEIDEFFGVNIDKFSSLENMKTFALEKMNEYKLSITATSMQPNGWLIGLLIFLMITARAKLSNQRKKLLDKKMDLLKTRRH